MSNDTITCNSPKHKNKLGYIDPTVAGIDIGDKVIHVAFPDGKGGVFVEEFGTTTSELHVIAQKLKTQLATYDGSDSNFLYTLAHSAKPRLMYERAPSKTRLFVP